MCPDHSPSEKEVSTENQSKNMEAGTETEIMSKCYLLDFPSVYFLETWTSCLRVVPLTPDWNLPHPSLIKKRPASLAYSQSDGSIFSTEVPYFKMNLFYVKLTIKNNHPALIINLKLLDF